jgi:REP element-mobilizing transposase RayT
MHFVLRSSKAKGELSFRRPRNTRMIHDRLTLFARKQCVRILQVAIHGNHIHLHIRLASRHTYPAFIRALTAAIAMAVTGSSRWRKAAGKFWDYRPFSRIVRGRRGFHAVRDYLTINTLEAVGFSRQEARFTVEWERAVYLDRLRGMARAGPESV